jgi:crotonobetainyl-CoA:carnitine CoA-transferase CaiB-like acyl-CoA transferase
MTIAPEHAARPLDGIRVVDLTRLLPGPFCSLILAGLGAEVIKIEPPGGGDPARLIETRLGGHGDFHAFIDRGKRSVVLDLKQPDGRDLLLRLIERADVVLESFRTGVARRLGIDYETVAARHPRLVYCSITAYGSLGPHAERPGHDVNFIGVAGVLDRLRAADGMPVVPAVQIGDVGAGSMPAVQAILAALLARERGGAGRQVTVAAVQHLQAWLGLERAFGGRRVFAGTLPFYNVYATADGGHMTLGAVEPRYWAAFCTAVEREEWIPRQDDSTLVDEVRALFATRPLADWSALADEIEACLEPVLSLDDAAELAARGRELPTGLAPGTELLPGVWFGRAVGESSPAPPGVNELAAAPDVGADTRAVLAEVGVDPIRLRELASHGVIDGIDL